jgi:hypothetical protein
MVGERIRSSVVLRAREEIAVDLLSYLEGKVEESEWSLGW